MVEYKTESTYKNYFGKNLNNTQFIIGKIIEAPVKKSKSYKAIIEVQAVTDSTYKIYSKTGKLITYFQSTDAIKTLQVGDIILLKNNVKEIQEPANPNEFNYKRYLSFHQIHFQAYLRLEDWKKIGNEFSIFRFTDKIRNYLLDQLQKLHISNKEFAIASALILGYKSELDQETIQAYSSSGAMHVLAVSGLHVGIIYWIFLLLLKPLQNIRSGKILHPIIILFLLWFYAVLTGLSPSVLRATTMFSFVIVGKTLTKNIPIYNTLTVSAFFLLLINPYLVMEVGFQLSYLAVLGIVYIQPKLYQTWFSNFKFIGKWGNWIIDKIWVLTSVSIAAQIATFPLGLLYFHQFPNYFLFSNIFVIPIATLIIYFGVGLLAVSEITLLANPLSFIFSKLIKTLNFIVEFVEKLPYSIVQEIAISVIETWLIYGIILFLLVFLSTRKAFHLKIALLFCVIFCSFQLFETINQVSQKRITVYHINGESAIEFTDGTKAYFFADSALLSNQSKLLFHVKHNWWEHGIKTVETHDFHDIYTKKIKKDNLYIEHGIGMFFDKKFYIPQKMDSSFIPSYPMSIDLLIISHNNFISCSNLIQSFSSKSSIIDGSNYKSLCKTYLDESCYSLGSIHNKAFILNI